MITTIAQFKTFLEHYEFNSDNHFNWDGFNKSFAKKLATVGIDKIPGEFEYQDDHGYMVVLRAYLDADSQNKGIGLKIYQALLDTTLEFGLKGITSPAFSDEMGEQRTPAATALWHKLIAVNGGTITDCSEYVDADDAKYPGPYYDFIVDGSHKIIRQTA